jgi:hypothetical protein
MFPDNSIDPHQFEAALKLEAPNVKYLAPKHGEALVWQ